MEFALIKNRIARYTLSSQLDSCIEILRQIQENKQKNYPIWNILVLIKWTLLHTKDSIFRNKASVYDIQLTLMLIDKFEESKRLLSFKSKAEIKRSLRIIAYQQFWFQDHINDNVFDRQIQLYKLLKHKYDIDQEFSTLTGFSIQQFLNLCYSIILYFNADEINNGLRNTGFIYDDYFVAFNEKIGVKSLNLFISLLTLNNVKEVASLQKMSKECYQLYETNFLSTKPFIKIGSKIKTPHKAIFNQTCKYFIYDFLKAKSSRFSEELGIRMEKYIQLGLSELQLNYLNEKQIKSKYSELSKNTITDFIVNDDTLIECKAIELHPNAAVLRRTDLLSKTLKESIIKAYCQLLNTANSINSSKSYYALVVTYKEMYIGFGFDAWDEFLKDHVEEFAESKNISLSILPPENICYVDLETWDYIVQVMKEHKCTIPEIIEKAKVLNTNPSTEKMLMEQVLNEHFKIKRNNLKYLDEANKYLDIVPHYF